MADADFTAVDLVNRDLILEKLGPLMNNKVFSKFDEQERISGGEYGMGLLKLINGICKSQNHQTTVEQHWVDNDYMLHKAFEAAGELSPRAAGVFAVLVEYIIYSQDDCTPDVQVWNAESKFKEDEIKEKRIENSISWMRIQLGLE